MMMMMVLIPMCVEFFPYLEGVLEASAASLVHFADLFLLLSFMRGSREGGGGGMEYMYNIWMFAIFSVGVITRLELVERVSFGGEIEISRCHLEAAGVLLR